MENRPQDEYRTKDLGEAAALFCSESAKLLRLAKERDFFWFVFSNRQFCQDIANQYWFGELLVNAKTYQDALRSLKDRLFAQQIR